MESVGTLQRLVDSLPSVQVTWIGAFISYYKFSPFGVSGFFACINGYYVLAVYFVCLFD